MKCIWQNQLIVKLQYAQVEAYAAARHLYSATSANKNLNKLFPSDRPLYGYQCSTLFFQISGGSQLPVCVNNELRMLDLKQQHCFQGSKTCRDVLKNAFKHAFYKVLSKLPAKISFYKSGLKIFEIRL